MMDELKTKTMANTEGCEKHKEIIGRLQKQVDDLLTIPSMAQYVRERKMHLIDSRFKILDNLIEQGVLHA